MDKLLKDIYQELGICETYLANRGIAPWKQACLSDLIVADIDFEGKPLVLTKQTALAWSQLHAQAEVDNILLLPFSGFRSYLYQKGLIKAKLDKGVDIGTILTSLAPPGYSEHHTGRAIDITTAPCKSLTEEFEKTDAFAWLSEHASRFGFVLSFPRDNEHGFIYEPWHWCYSGEDN